MLVGLSSMPTYTTNNYSSVNTYQTSGNSQSSERSYSSTSSATTSSSSVKKSPSKDEVYLYTMVYVVGEGKDSQTGKTVPGDDSNAYRMDFYKDRLVDGDGTIFYRDPKANMEGCEVFKTKAQVIQGIETQIWVGMNYNFDQPQLMMFLMGDKVVSHRVYFMKETEWKQFISSGNTGGINENYDNSSSYYGFTCTVCKGTGQKKVSMHNTSHQSQWCEICKKSSYDLHSHVFCNECGGDGKVDEND